MKLLRSLFEESLKKKLLKRKKRKTNKDLAKFEDPLDDDQMGGLTDNGPKVG